MKERIIFQGNCVYKIISVETDRQINSINKGKSNYIGTQFIELKNVSKIYIKY